MNRIPAGESACEKTRKYLDAYVSNELLVETTHELLRHLESCAACSSELDARSRLRSRLKAAAEGQPVPVELRAKVRERIRRGSASRFAAGWGRWVLAAAAVVVAGSGLWLNFAPEKLPALDDRQAQYAYLQRISARMAAVLKLGLGDHVHCAVFRRYPPNPPPQEQMEAELGPEYQGLLPVVRSAVPTGYRIVMAHQCTHLGREYVHLTMEKDGELLSLVITLKRAGETLENLTPVRQPGIPMYEGSAARYQVSAFDAGNFIGYVVSDLKAKANLQVAMNLAPGVREFLLKTA